MLNKIDETGTGLARIAKSKRGFTLIELMIVVSIIGILAAISAPNYRWGIIKAREAVLQEDLYQIRSTLDQFAADQGSYPASLQDLVDKKYIKEIPKDPMTKGRDWVPVMGTASTTGGTGGGGGGGTQGVEDVHSASTLVGTDGRPYNEW